MNDPKEQPSANVEDLARYAVRADKMVFRIRACRRKDFDAAVAAELIGDGKGEFEALSAEESHFIHGWMRHAELDYLENGQPNDEKLIAAIQFELDRPASDDELHTMSG